METALYILIGLITGAIFTYLLTRSRLSSIHNSELLYKNNEQASLKEQIAAMDAKMEVDKESLKVARDAMPDLQVLLSATIVF